MPETWTGNLIGRMHNKGITYDELARRDGGWKGVHFHDPEWAAEAHRYQETHGGCREHHHPAAIRRNGRRRSCEQG